MPRNNQPLPAYSLSIAQAAAAVGVGDVPASGLDGTFGHLTSDSRTVGSDSCFVAVPGVTSDGHSFIPQAIQSGARLIVHSAGGIGESVRRQAAQAGTALLPVADPALALAALAAEFYRNPACSLSVIGVTGTNGKTTVTYLLEQLLGAAGIIGTIQYRIGRYCEPAKNTTPDIITIQRLFARMQQARCRYAVMEVSSHALAQSRVRGILFDTAVFTNLTQDHLDYHGDREAYFQAKSLLFTGPGAPRQAAINIDDDYGRRLCGMTPASVISYGIEADSAQLRAVEVTMSPHGAVFYMEYAGERVRVRSPLIGRHNVYNMLAVAGCAISYGLSLKTIARRLGSACPPPGRLQPVVCGQPFAVYVDYAHTEDALRNVLCSLREFIGGGRIVLVFGCGGDRDRGKRPLMGRVAAELADIVYITSDNARGESAQSIAREIVSGIPAECRQWHIELDRRQAIGRAIGDARDGDIILIAGKGHERQQICGNQVVDFDDRQVARESLSACGYGGVAGI